MAYIKELLFIFKFSLKHHSVTRWRKTSNYSGRSFSVVEATQEEKVGVNTRTYNPDQTLWGHFAKWRTQNTPVS